MGSAGVLSAFAPTWEWLALARFAAGTGAAFFFSPGLSLISSYYPPGQRGPLIGLYNGGFSLGGAVGLAGGAYLGEVGGWPLALGLGGVGLLVVTAASAVLLPRLSEPESGRHLARILAAGRGVLLSRSMWALSLALTGFWGAIYIVAQYFVQFAHDVHAAWGVATAAALAAGVVVASFPGGPAGGWLAEQGRDRRVLIGAFGALAGVLVLAIPFVPLWGLWPVVLLLGFVDGIVFAILYLIPSYLAETQGEGLALGVALVNSIQVLLGSVLAVAFGFIVSWWGYTTGWLYAGAITLVLLPLLAWVSSNRAGDVREVGSGPAVPAHATAGEARPR